jgi:hypothetical protein
MLDGYLDAVIGVLDRLFWCSGFGLFWCYIWVILVLHLGYFGATFGLFWCYIRAV